MIVKEQKYILDKMSEIRAAIWKLQKRFEDRRLYRNTSNWERAIGGYLYPAVITDTIAAADGTVVLPGYGFWADRNTGMWRTPGNNIAFSINGFQYLEIENNNLDVDVPVHAIDGAAATPSYSFDADATMGFYRVGANSLGLSIGGVQRWGVSLVRTISTVPFRGPNGAVGAPSYSFIADTDCGMYYSATQLNFAVGGVQSFVITNVGGGTVTVDGLSLTGGAITDASGAISFGNENLSSTGSITGNSFITASNIGIAADTNLIQLTGANAMTLNGTLTVSDGGSINLQEDITFTGATTENLIKFPDNLATALDFTEAGNSYMKFVSTNNSEGVRFSKNIGLFTAPDPDYGIDIAFTLASVTGRTSVHAGRFLSDITNDDTAALQARGTTQVLYYRGTQNSTNSKGQRAIDATAFNYNTGIVTSFSGFRLDQRNLSTGTISNMNGLWINIVANSGGGTVDNYYAFKVDAITIGTNSYAYYCANVAAAGRWNFYAGGTAANRFKGELQIDSDTYGLVLGSGQDSVIYDNGSYLLFDCDKQNVTGREFKFLNGNIWLDNARQAGAPTPDGYLLVKDSTGTQYKIPCEAA